MEEVTIYHHRAARTYTGLGIDSWRAQQNLVHQDPGERNSDPTGDCPRLACGCPGVSGRGVGLWWPAARLGAWTLAVHALDLLRVVTVIFITSTMVWPQVNSREGTQLHPSTEYWIKDLLSMAPPIRRRPSIPLSQSIPSGSFHKPLILLHQRAERMKANQSDYLDHSLV